jgi:hypothetical protein
MPAPVDHLPDMGRMVQHDGARVAEAKPLEQLVLQGLGLLEAVRRHRVTTGTPIASSYASNASA